MFENTSNFMKEEWVEGHSPQCCFKKIIIWDFPYASTQTLENIYSLVKEDVNEGCLTPPLVAMCSICGSFFMLHTDIWKCFYNQIEPVSWKMLSTHVGSSVCIKTSLCFHRYIWKHLYHNERRHLVEICFLHSVFWMSPVYGTFLIHPHIRQKTHQTLWNHKI